MKQECKCYRLLALLSILSRGELTVHAAGFAAIAICSAPWPGECGVRVGRVPYVAAVLARREAKKCSSANEFA